MGLALPAILAAVGFATDVTTIMRAKVSLQASLDAATHTRPSRSFDPGGNSVSRSEDLKSLLTNRAALR